jgi:lipopolysaccharide exporter
MSKIDSYWLRSGIYTFANKLSFLFLGFGSFYMLVRTMPKSDFGIWALFVSITTLIETGRNGLIQNALVKAMVDSSKDSTKVISASFALNAIMTLFFVVLFLGIYFFLPIQKEYEALKMMILYYCITTIALFPLSQCNFIQQGKLDFKGVFFTGLIRQGGFFCVILYFYLNHKTLNLVQLVNWQSGSVAIASISALLFGRKYISFRFPIDWSLVKELFHYGKYTMGTNLSSMLFKSIDQLMLGWFMTPIAVATYNSAIRVNNLVEYPASAMVEILFPKSAKKASEEGIKGVENLYHISLAYMLAMFIPAVLLIELLAYPLILLAAGESYLDAVLILRIVALAGLVIPFTRQFGMIMDSTGHPHLNFRMLLVNVVINLIFNLLFINWMGVLGAAIGTTLAYLLNAILSQTLLQRVINVNYKQIPVLLVNVYVQVFETIKKAVF